MPDEMTLANGETEANVQAASPVAQGQPVTPKAEPIDDSRIRSLEERIAQLSTQLETSQARAHSLADKKRNEALRKAKLLEEMAPVLGMDAERLTEAKRAVIEKAFYDDTPEPEEPKAPPAPTAQAPRTPSEAMASILTHIEENTSLTADDDEAVRLARKFSKLQPKTAEEQKAMMRQYNEELAEAIAAKKARVAKDKVLTANANAVADTIDTAGSASGTVLGTSGMAAGTDSQYQREYAELQKKYRGSGRLADFNAAVRALGEKYGREP